MKEVCLQFGVDKKRANELMVELQIIWNACKNLSDAVYDIEKSQASTIEKLYMVYMLARTPKDSLSKMNF